MTLGALDYGIVVAFLVLCLALGFAGRQRAGRGLRSYFLAGRRLGWFAAGTSMAAGALAVDTPLAVAALTAQEGIAGNWFWWHGVFGCVAAAFVFGPLWRRMEILTDNELVEIRYSGPSAEVLRGVRGFLDGIIRPAVVISLLSLIVGELARVTIGIPPGLGIVVFMGVAALYATFAGLRGVVATGAAQLGLVMLGTTLFGFRAAHALIGDAPTGGGLAEAIRSLARVGAGRLEAAAKVADVPTFLPTGSELMPFSSILVFVLVAWWARGNADAGNYLAQRAFASRDHRHSRLAFLWFGVVHFCLRPWPWIAVGLVGVIGEPVKWMTGPRLDAELGYVDLAGDLLPPGLRGILVAGLIGAFLSGVSAQLNCGSAYIVNDLWRRFLARGRPETHYVRTARVATVVLGLISLLLTVLLSSVMYTSIKRVWEFLLLTGGGIGGVLILRWFWWRVNAWSELAAIVAAPVFAVFALLVERQLGPHGALRFPYSFLWVTVLTSAVWIGVTFLTAPVPEVNLLRFYMRCRPGGPGWRRLAFRIPGFEDDGPGRRELGWALLAAAVLYGGMFGIGHLVIGSAVWGSIMLAGAIVGAGLLWWNWRAD